MSAKESKKEANADKSRAFLIGWISVLGVLALLFASKRLGTIADDGDSLREDAEAIKQDAIDTFSNLKETGHHV